MSGGASEVLAAPPAAPDELLLSVLAAATDLWIDKLRRHGRDSAPAKLELFDDALAATLNAETQIEGRPRQDLERRLRARSAPSWCPSSSTPRCQTTRSALAPASPSVESTRRA